MRRAVPRPLPLVRGHLTVKTADFRAHRWIFAVIVGITAGCSNEPADTTTADVSVDAVGPDAGVSSDVSADDSGPSTANDAASNADAQTCESFVECAIGDPGPCRRVVCKTGLCAFELKAEGLACDDGLKCTTNDRCKEGTCTAETVADCDDSDACTTDDCDEIDGCFHHSASKGTGCDDGHACTKDDGCIGGTCAGLAVDCEDNNKCTTDACSPSKGCVHQPLAGNCNDADPCTEFDSCKAGKCVGYPVDKDACDDKDPCTQDACLPNSGCFHSAAEKAGESCDDGNPCTFGEKCADGTCTPEGKSDCSCINNADCAPLDDGNACNGTMVCDVSALPFACTLDVSTVVACSGASTNQCTAPTCDTKSGVCTYLAKKNGTFCDADGDVCSHEDVCIGAKCVHGAPLVCTDGNPCTLDACDPAKGCVFFGAAVEGKSCDADGSWCTQNDVCKGGVCLAGAVTKCADDNACTKDLCDPKTGKCAPNVTAFEGNACVVPNDKCAVKSSCKQGVCVAEVELKCDDGNVCTTGLCVGSHGCVYAVKESGTPCNADDNACTLGDDCQGGVCLPGAATSCDDGNGCTADFCDPKHGTCSHNGGKLHGLNCNDGSACTIGETCVAAKCVLGKPRSCDDGDPCTTDSCDPSFGDGVATADGCTAVVADVACEDGDFCLGPDKCVKGSCVSGPAISCLDGNECTNEGCNKATGCVFIDVDGPCNAGGTHGICYEQGCVLDEPFGCGLFDDHVVPVGLDAGFGVARDPNNGVVVAGWRALQDPPIVAGWLASMQSASQGNWYRVVPQVRALYGVTIDGNVAAAAGHTSKCEGAVFVASLSSGATVAFATVGGATALRDVVAAGNGLFVAVGWGPTLNTDAKAVGVGSDGKVKWLHTEGGSGFDAGFAAVETTRLGTVMVGTRDATAALRVGPCGNAHPKTLSGQGFATALSRDGDVLWRRTYAHDPDGQHTMLGLYGAGDMRAGGSLFVGVTGQADIKTWRMVAVRVDRDGHEIWRQVYGRGIAEGVTQRQTGGFGVVGSQPLSSFPGSPLLIADASGTVLKQRYYSANGGEDTLTRATEAPNGGIFASGLTSGNATSFFDARILRTDAWGQAHCGKSGKCQKPAKACDDGDACTLDSCVFDKGCAHSTMSDCANGLVDKTGSRDADIDLDHDGVCAHPSCTVVAVDTCPITWNPDNKKNACPPLPLAFSPSRRLLFVSTGADVGGMLERRTHELVEIPLVTGLVDDSVVVKMALNGSSVDTGSLKLKSAAVGAKPARGIRDAASSAVALDKNGSITVLGLPSKRLDRVTVGLRIRPSTTSGEVARLLDGSDERLRMWIVNSRLHCGFSGVDGAFHTVSADHVEDHVVRNQWHHVACVVGRGRLQLMIDRALAAAAPTVVPVMKAGSTTLVLGGGSTATGMAGRYDDLALFDRDVPLEELRTWGGSANEFGEVMVPAAQADYDDIRVSVATPYHALPSTVPAEVVGIRRMSDSWPGLRALWPLAQGAWDIGPSSWHGKIVAGTSVRDRFGVSNGAVQFEGVGRVETASNWAVSSSEPFAVELWAKLKKDQDHGLVGALDSSGRGFALTVTGKGKTPGVRVHLKDNNGNGVVLDAPGSFADGRWHHFGVQRTVKPAKRIALYVDGVEVGAKLDTTATAIGGTGMQLHIGAIRYGKAATQGASGAFCDLVLRGPDDGAITMATRAQGLPRIRMLTSTLPFADSYGAWRYPEHRVHFGGVKTKAAPVYQVALDGKTTCGGVVNSCIGIAGWWQLRDVDWTTATDTASAARLALYGPAAIPARGRVEIARTAAGKAVLSVPQLGVDIDKSFTLEVGLRPDLVGKGVALSRFLGKRGLRWVGVPAGLALTMVDGTSAAAPVAKLQQGRWATVAMRRNGQEIGAYVDRNLHSVVSGKTLGVADAETTLLVGTAADGFVGAIDEVRVANRALSPDEMIAHPRTSVGVGCDHPSECPTVSKCSTAKCNTLGWCEYVDAACN